MAEIPILYDIVLILGISILLSLIFQRLRVPSILGFFMAGAIIGPYGLSLISSSHNVEVLSQMGVILLLFVIGIEFSLKSIAAVKNVVLGGTIIQLAIVILLTAGSLMAFNMELNRAVFLGILFSLSSTVIVLKAIQTIRVHHGLAEKITIGATIVQDLLAVPLMLLIPLLAGEAHQNGETTVLLFLIKVLAILLLTFLSAKYIVPYVLRRVILSHNRELFVLTVVLICFATALLTSWLGLTLALGAFLAGLIISESEYSHQAIVQLIPFREIFLSFFFVSIGMLLNTTFLFHNFWVVLLLTAVIILGKGIIGYVSIAIFGYHPKTSIKTGIYLAQVGEFSFILASIGLTYNLLSNDLFQLFLAISLLTMAIAPFLIGRSEQISDYLILSLLPRPIKKRLFRVHNLKKEHELEHQLFSDHIVIIGYGLNGKNVSRAAKYAEIPYVIIEYDPLIVERLKQENEPVIFGDANSPMVLRLANIEKARVVVIAISDLVSTKSIVEGVRGLSELVYIVVRTRYVENLNDLLLLGADEVIPEEYETSIEIFTVVLRKYLVPRTIIDGFVNCMRHNNYQLLCAGSNQQDGDNYPISIPDMEIVSIKVLHEYSNVVGKSIKELQLRDTFGINILAVRRNNQYITNITKDLTIEPDDVLYVFGKRYNLSNLSHFIRK